MLVLRLSWSPNHEAIRPCEVLSQVSAAHTPVSITEVWAVDMRAGVLLVLVQLLSGFRFSLVSAPMWCLV